MLKLKSVRELELELEPVAVAWSRELELGARNWSKELECCWRSIWDSKGSWSGSRSWIHVKVEKYRPTPQNPDFWSKTAFPI